MLCKTLSLSEGDSKENGQSSGGHATSSTMANGMKYSQMERQQLAQESDRYLAFVQFFGPE